MKKLVVVLVTMAFASGAFASTKCSASNRSAMGDNTNPSKVVLSSKTDKHKNGRK